jgi:hypothetical protein
MQASVRRRSIVWASGRASSDGCTLGLTVGIWEWENVHTLIFPHSIPTHSSSPKRGKLPLFSDEIRDFRTNFLTYR